MRSGWLTVAKVLNFNRSCIYDWLKRYDQGGYEALESRKLPGAKPLITPEMEGGLEERVRIKWGPNSRSRCTPLCAAPG